MVPEKWIWNQSQRARPVHQRERKEGNRNRGREVVRGTEGRERVSKRQSPPKYLLGWDHGEGRMVKHGLGSRLLVELEVWPWLL